MKHRINRIMARGGLCLALALLAAACGGDDRRAGTEDGTAAQNQATESSLPSQDSLTDTELGQIDRSHLQLALSWTRSSTRRSPPDGEELAALREWQVRGRESFDRFLLTFGEDDPMPGYEVSFVEAPIRECGSEAELEIQGRAFLRVRVSGISPAASFERDLSIRPRRNIRELRLICETDDALEFVLPLNSPRDYRILEARSPRRLVVDVINRTGTR